MIYDSAILESDPFLIEMAREVSQLEKQKDNARKAHEACPDDAKARLCYDAAVIVWARATNKYHSAIKAVIGL